MTVAGSEGDDGFQPLPAAIIGHKFVHEYYTYLCKDPGNLHKFYKAESVFSRGVEGEGLDAVISAVGPEEIRSEIMECVGPFQHNVCKANILCIESQESRQGGVLVLVTGYLTYKKNPEARHFTQAFFLDKQTEPYEGYFVLNDILRYTATHGEGNVGSARHSPPSHVQVGSSAAQSQQCDEKVQSQMMPVHMLQSPPQAPQPTAIAQHQQPQQMPVSRATQILVQMPGGQSLALAVDLAAPVTSLKKRIEEEAGHASGQLSFNGMQLEDGCSLSEYGVQHGSALSLSQPPLAAPAPTKASSLPPVAPGFEAQESRQQQDGALETLEEGEEEPFEGAEEEEEEDDEEEKEEEEEEEKDEEEEEEEEIATPQPAEEVEQQDEVNSAENPAQVADEKEEGEEQPKTWASMAGKLRQGPGQLAPSRVRGWSTPVLPPPGTSGLKGGGSHSSSAAAESAANNNNSSSEAGGQTMVWIRLPQDKPPESQEFVDCINGLLAEARCPGRAIDLHRNGYLVVSGKDVAEAVVQLGKDRKLLFQGKTLKAEYPKAASQQSRGDQNSGYHSGGAGGGRRGGRGGGRGYIAGDRGSEQRRSSGGGGEHAKSDAAGGGDGSSPAGRNASRKGGGRGGGGAVGDGAGPEERSAAGGAEGADRSRGGGGGGRRGGKAGGNNWHGKT